MILKVKTFTSQIKPSVGSFTNRMDHVKQINKQSIGDDKVELRHSVKIGDKF